MKKPDFKRALNEMLSKPTSDKTQAVMSQGQVIDILIIGAFFNSYSLLFYSKKKKKIGIARTVSVSWTMPIHTRRYSLTVDSFHKPYFAFQALQLQYCSL